MWNTINKYLGWRQWAVLRYNSIFENLFILFYLIAIKQFFNGSYLLISVVFLLLSISATSLGYLVNDFSDRTLDRLHGKPNTFAEDSDRKAGAVLTVFGGSVILFSLPFIGNGVFILLMALWLFLALGYSLPPLRFKERGVIGLLLISVTQRLLPVWMLFAVFEFPFNSELIILSVYIILRGITSDLNHQLQDYRNDLRTQTETAVVVKGDLKMGKLFGILLELEKWTLLIFLVYSVAFSVTSAGLHFVLIILLIVYMLLFTFGIWEKISTPDGAILITNPYEGKHIHQVVQLVFPNLILPVGLLIFLSVKNPVFSVFFIFYIVVFRLYDPKTFSSSFLGRLIKKNINRRGHRS